LSSGVFWLQPVGLRELHIHVVTGCRVSVSDPQRAKHLPRRLIVVEGNGRAAGSEGRRVNEVYLTDGAAYGHEGPEEHPIHVEVGGF